MKLIAVIWAFLILSGSLHNCVSEMYFVSTNDGGYIITLQDECGSTEKNTCCAQNSGDNEKNEDSECCTLGVCSCTIVLYNLKSGLSLNSSLELLLNSNGFDAIHFTDSNYSQDIFQPPRHA